MERQLRAGAIAGAAAPFTFILAGVGIAWLEQDFMEQLGWDHVPSGLALGPHGWLQVVNFVVFGLGILAFALAVRAVPARTRWQRVAPVLLAIAGVAAVMLAFKDDPDGETTWHGVIHGGAYLTWLTSIVISYPLTWRRLRGHPPWSGPRWSSALALLLLPTIFLLPDSGAASNFLFFAVVLMPLAAIAIRLAAGAMRARATSTPSARLT